MLNAYYQPGIGDTLMNRIDIVLPSGLWNLPQKTRNYNKAKVYIIIIINFFVVSYLNSQMYLLKQNQANPWDAEMRIYSPKAAICNIK